MQLLAFPFFILLLISSALCNCPPGYIYGSSFNRCYTAITKAASFLLAEEFCQSSGGHLASIQNGFEASFISGIMQSASISSPDFWLGLNYLMYSNWSWTDNSPSSYANWGLNQPADPSANQCGAVQTADNTWKKSLCNQAKPYICANDFNSSWNSTCSPKRPCGKTCPIGYTFYRGDCQCYKMWTSSVIDSYDYMTQVCAMNGAKLAKITDGAQNDFLAQFIQNNFNGSWPVVGFTCSLSKNMADCKWTDGTSLADGYTNFMPLFPDGNQYGTMVNNGWITTRFAQNSCLCQIPAV